VILPIARECARMDGDLWGIYMGNNEMVGPFGASTVFGSRVPPVSVAHLDIALKATRIGQFFARISQGSSNAKEPETWGGLAMFAGLQRRGPGFVAQLRAERADNKVAGLACSLRGMGAGAMQPIWAELSTVAFPCTFVAGQLDHGYVASARRLRDTVPHGRVEIVARAGHPVHLERPEAFARVLAGHLASARAGAPAEGEPEARDSEPESSAASSTWD